MVGYKSHAITKGGGHLTSISYLSIKLKITDKALIDKKISQQM